MQKPVEFRGMIVDYKKELYVGEWLEKKNVR
jgi:hypothetical protein